MSESFTFNLIKNFFEFIFGIIKTFIETLKQLFLGRIHLKNFVGQSSRIAFDSIGIIMLLVCISAMILSLQISTEMVKQGAGDYVGAVVAAAVLRELGPIMGAFAIISALGSSVASEVASMKVTDQVSAMKAIKVDPFRYVVLPRILAGACMLPVVNMLANVAGIFSGMLIAKIVSGLNVHIYLEGVFNGIGVKDVGVTLLKSFVFGFLIFLTSTSIGFDTKGGAKEVGQSTTKAVVWSFIFVVIINFVLSKIFYSGG